MADASSRKISVALMTYGIDNRPAKGSALYGRKLVENLLGDPRFDFYLVHFDEVTDPMYQKAKEIKIPLIQLPYGSRFVSLMRFFWHYRKKKFDIIHWFQPRLYPFFWLAPARKIIVTAHGAGDITAPGRKIFSRHVFNFVLRYFNKYIDVIIAGSKFGKEEIVEFYHSDPSKTLVTYYGGGKNYARLDKQESLRQIADKYSLPQPFILNVSRLQPHKNIDGLINAYIHMRDTSSRTEKLVIVGWPSLDYQKLYDMARESKYNKDIVFVKFVEGEDLNALYSAAEIFVFPSYNEGFGLPVIEAMASGTPVITSTVTSMPEIAGDAAVLVDPADHKAIGEAMNRVLSDTDLKNSLILKGLERAKEFTWERTGEETKKIYLDLMK